MSLCLFVESSFLSFDFVSQVGDTEQVRNYENVPKNIKIYRINVKDVVKLLCSQIIELVAPQQMEKGQEN